MATTSKFDFGLINDQIKEHTDQIGDLQTGLVKYIENGDNATLKTYVKDDYLIWKGEIYRVNDNIPIGNPIAGHATAASDYGDGCINKINSKIKNIVQESTRTANTDQFGLAGAGFGMDSSKRLLSAYGNSPTDKNIYIPFAYMKVFHVLVLDSSTLQPVKNTSVTFNYVYYETAT